MNASLAALFYLIASICFILALKGLSHPESSRRGNFLGMTGMAIAVLSVDEDRTLAAYIAVAGFAILLIPKFFTFALIAAGIAIVSPIVLEMIG